MTGKTPFHGGSTAELFQRHLDEDVIAPSLRCPDAAISPALDRVLLRVLAKDPAMRYASAAKFAAALLAATPTTERVRPSSLRRAGFSTEAPTQDWPVSLRRRLAEGTRPQPTNRAEQLRTAIGTAIVTGDPEAIASSYLDLARALVAAHRADLAAWELEQAIDVLTGGQGPESGVRSSQLWRILLALAAIYDGAGDRDHARTAALHARTAALNAHSPVGIDRSCALLQRLARAIAA